MMNIACDEIEIVTSTTDVTLSDGVPPAGDPYKI